ncbi:ACP S-malonyltransferase [bacterium]|jgi:trans-AT polyketide synthase, acyltransferase and oxidoreductase domains|nr:ACP S-malonyltransferase [bacterium]
MTQIYVFPGQGSQKLGMGEELFDKYPDIVATADKILGYSIKTLCLEDPEGNLNKTEFTQPALYVVNALHYMAEIETGPKADFLAGHSLGEISALYASGALTFEDGLTIVKERGSLMSQEQGGGMAAVIGLSSEKISESLRANNLDKIDLANFNSPMQTVISGDEAQIKESISILKEAGARLVIQLKVSGAFHSRFMANAQAKFKKFLTTFSINKNSIPVISNITGKPYDLENFIDTLAGQLTESVQWTSSIQYLLAKDTPEIKEIGPGKVLTGLLKKIKTEKTSA